MNNLGDVLKMSPSVYGDVSRAERALLVWSAAANAGDGLPAGVRRFLVADDWAQYVRHAGYTLLPEGARPGSSGVDNGMAWLGPDGDAHHRSWMAMVGPDTGAELARRLPDALREFAFPLGKAEWPKEGLLDAAVGRHPTTAPLAAELVRAPADSASPLVYAAVKHWADLTLAPHGAVTGMVLRAGAGRALDDAGLLVGGGNGLGLSRAFAANQAEMVRGMTAAADGDLAPWVQSFARSAERSAKAATTALGMVRTAQAEVVQEMAGQRRADGISAYVASTPYFTLASMASECGIAYNTAANQVRGLITAGFVSELDGVRNERGQWFESMAAQAALLGKEARIGAVANDVPLPKEHVRKSTRKGI